MEIETNRKGDEFIKLSKKEFDANYFVGSLCEYHSNGGPDSIVKIMIYGKVPDLKYCVIKKDKSAQPANTGDNQPDSP